MDFFRDHEADHKSFGSKIDRIRSQVRIEHNKAIDSYAQRVYGNAIARMRMGSSL
ncbi:hypothetical protein HY498_03990 [Candidatus Woesearchaeota archaeon]|nr:hypothetical protein [Candidatus Woesearchaeota archaeon]